MTRLLFVLAAVLVAPIALAQTPCVNGFATVASPPPGAVTQGPFPCRDVDLMAWIPASNTGQLRSDEGSDLWGWTDAETGREYAIVGMVDGTVFVDVTEPTAPKVLGKLATRTGSSFWRDMKVYGDHAFIVSDSNGNHGMQVFDLRTLRGLDANALRNFTAVTVFDGPANARVGSAHNIVLNEDSGFAYVVGSNSCNGGLNMIDVRDPEAPVFAGCFSSDGYTHDAQCVTYDGPDTDYTGHEICFASNEDTITIVDVTNKSAPTQIARAFYPNPSYTHQGWLTDDGRHFLVDDEVDSSSGGTRTFVMDVEDLDNVSFAFRHGGSVPTRDHNQYVRGGYTYQSNYQGGLRILDLSNLDAQQMPEVAYFDTYPQGNSSNYNGQWSNYPYFASGIVVANDIENGLFILRPTNLIVAGASAPAAGAFSLSAASPNPTSGTSTLALTVAAPEAVRAVVLDATGREVATVFEGTVTDAATLRVETAGLAAGVYVVRVVGATFSATRRLSVTR